MKINTKTIAIAALIVITIIAVFPWFKSGVAATDDFRHHIAKFWWMKYSFDHYGAFLEWMPFIYSGWPMTHFYHSLPYFASLPFILLMQPVAALKASIVASFILAALAMFIATKKLLKKTEVAALASIFYLLAPIHFEFAYLSGSISRLWAYIFLPLVFAYYISLLEERGKKNLIFAGLSIAALSFTDVNIMIAASYFLFTYTLYYFFIKQKKIEKSKLKEIAICAIMVIGLLSFWLIPLLTENQDSSAASLTSQIFGGTPGNAPIRDVLWREFGRGIRDGLNYRSFYVGYVLLALSLLGMYRLQFEQKKIFGFLGILGIILTLDTTVLSIFPLAKSIIFGTYFLLIGTIFLSMIAGEYVYDISKKKNGLAYLVIILVIFFIDVGPAITTNYWSYGPTEDYTNSPQIIDAFNYIKEQPGLFRTYSLVGELPFIYTEKFEIGIDWTGYREGAFKPIRDLTDVLFDQAKKNVAEPSFISTLGYMGDKYLVLPCISGLEKQLPLDFKSGDVCVYENPLFSPLVTSPAKIKISPQITGGANAYILEDCFSNCNIQAKRVNISETAAFDPEKISFTTSGNDPGFVLVKSAYFQPHWHAYVNNNEVKIRKAWPYYMIIEVPAGVNKVLFRYQTNSTHLVAWFITFLTLLLFGYYLIRPWLVIT